MSIPFAEFKKLYPEALKQAGDCLSKTKLSILEEIALRFCHALEEHSLDLKQGKERVFLSDLLTKTTNELFALIGTLRYGAFLSSYHHTRSIFELYAALEHVYCVPSKVARKLEKYVEYKEIAKFLHYRDRKRLLSTGHISEKDFLDSCAISEKEFQDLAARVSNWNRIWKLKDQDPASIKNWHHPAAIENLFRSSESTKPFWQAYESICHITHLSPLSAGLTEGNLLIGFPRNNNGYDYKKINFPIVYCILASQAIAAFLQSTVQTGLMDGVLDLD